MTSLYRNRSPVKPNRRPRVDLPFGWGIYPTPSPLWTPQGPTPTPAARDCVVTQSAAIRPNPKIVPQPDSAGKTDGVGVKRRKGTTQSPSDADRAWWAAETSKPRDETDADRTSALDRWLEGSCPEPELTVSGAWSCDYLDHTEG